MADFISYVQQNAADLAPIVGNDGGFSQSGAKARLLANGGNNDFVKTYNNAYGINQKVASLWDAYNKTKGADAAGGSGAYGGAGGADSSSDYSPADVAYLDDQANDLNSLLGRTDNGLNQGIQRLDQDYQGEVNSQNSQKNQALNDYSEKRDTTKGDKLSTYNTINRNANNGYRSLAQIIGRSAGTGSSAFQDLLPDVVGRDTGAKRATANETYGKNMQGIDKAQQQTEISFASILDDLARQRKRGEEDLRTGVENQKQTLLGQLKEVAAKKAQAAGGGYAEVKAAQAPLQAKLESSRNNVESFFSQFNPGIKGGQAVIATPDLAQYTADRSTINANAGGQQSDNPYADLLRKRLQEQQAPAVAPQQPLA